MIIIINVYNSNVSRRTGGLEKMMDISDDGTEVSRRTGGLEN